MRGSQRSANRLQYKLYTPCLAARRPGYHGKQTRRARLGRRPLGEAVLVDPRRAHAAVRRRHLPLRRRQAALVPRRALHRALPRLLGRRDRRLPRRLRTRRAGAPRLRHGHARQHVRRGGAPGAAVHLLPRAGRVWEPARRLPQPLPAPPRARLRAAAGGGARRRRLRGARGAVRRARRRRGQLLLPLLPADDLLARAHGAVHLL